MGVTFATYTPSISLIPAPSDRLTTWTAHPRSYPFALPPQRLAAFEKAGELFSVRQALVVPEGGYAERTHGVRYAEPFFRSEAPKVPGEVPRVEGVAGADRVNLLHAEGRPGDGVVVHEGQAPLFAQLEYHLARPRGRKLSREVLVLSSPERTRLVVSDEQQVDARQDLLDEAPRLRRPPQVGAVVDVEADARLCLARRPEGEGPALLGEGRGDAGEVEKLRASEEAGVEGLRRHRRCRGAPTIVVDPRVRPDLLAQVEPGREAADPPHPGGIHPFSPDPVQDELARLVVPEQAHPPRGDAQPGEGDRNVRLRAPDLELEARGVAKTPRPRGDAEDHSLADR